MDYKQEYKKWLESDNIDETTKAELLSIKNDENEIKYRFMQMLEFGTAGLRGILGAGTNMMNVYVVRYVTQALANLINAQGEQAAKRGVCIAYDSRIMSKEFSKECASVLSANGIKAFLFDELRPTPELSFAIRYKKAIAGINITASHNPKEYNGYKIYWEDGAQLPPNHANEISETLKKIDIFSDIKIMSYESAVKNGITEIIGEEIDNEYLKRVREQALPDKSVEKFADEFKLIYTPIHGSGYKLVPKALKMLGLKHVITVEEQMKPDGTFPTVKSPNPENKEVFNSAIELAKKEDVDLIIGTDPDTDRVGLVVRDDSGDYGTLSGNQIGVLLIDYIIKAYKENASLPKNACVIKSIVSTTMANAICEKNDVTLLEVLTGFKYIGEKIKEFEKTNEHTFIFGFEESYGYLKGTYARDKDAVVASMLIAQMACWYKNKGMSLYDGLNSLYEEYGFYGEKTDSITMSGLDGIEKMKKAGENLRNSPLAEIAGVKVVKIRDYQKGVTTELLSNKETKITLPSADVLFYELEDGSSVIYRPSGTEPKIKIYVMVKGSCKENCKEKIGNYVQAIKDIINKKEG